MYKPNYTITLPILNSISRLAEIKSYVDRSRILPLNEAQLKREAIARMAHTSTSIEGNKLAQYQVDKVLAGEKVHADEKSIIEVKNYQNALKLVNDMADSGEHLSVEAILKVHAILMKGLLEEPKIGHFRPGSVFIVDDLGDKGEKLRFEGPPASKVAFLVHELVSWVKSAQSEDIHPVIIAGIFHTQFVHIHPFADGNGRITRLLTILLLYKYNWDFHKIIVLEDYYNRDRRAYYDALASGWEVKYKEGSDLTSWLEYYSKGFVIEAEKVMESLEAIGFGAVSRDTQVYLDRDEIKMMDFLTTVGRMTSADVQDILGIAKRTAQLKIKSLLDKGLLNIEGSGPSTCYTLKQAHF